MCRRRIEGGLERNVAKRRTTEGRESLDEKKERLDERRNQPNSISYREIVYVIKYWVGSGYILFGKRQFNVKNAKKLWEDGSSFSFKTKSSQF